MYWFAAQQQTITSRRQKFDLFYPKFSAKFKGYLRYKAILCHKVALDVQLMDFFI